MPAVSRTRRCLLIACRVTREPCVSSEIEHGRPAARRAIKARRVSSPRAKNTEAWARLCERKLLRDFRDIVLDVLHLLGPSPFVAAEGFESEIAGKLIESGFNQSQQSAPLRLLEPEFDQSSRSVGVFAALSGAIERFGMRPGKGEESFGLHFLDDGFPLDVLVSGIGHVAGGNLSCDKWPVELDAKPFPEFTIVGESAPDAGNRSVEFDAFFNAVSHKYATSRLHIISSEIKMQPDGCVFVPHSQKIRGTATPSRIVPHECCLPHAHVAGVRRSINFYQLLGL